MQDYEPDQLVLPVSRKFSVKDIPGYKTTVYIARIEGPDDKYYFKRTFLDIHKYTTDWGSVYFCEFDPCWVYEFSCKRSPDDKTKYSFRQREYFYVRPFEYANIHWRSVIRYVSRLQKERQANYKAFLEGLKAEYGSDAGPKMLAELKAEYG